MKLTTVFLVLCSFSSYSNALPFEIPDFGRWILPTTGEVWPKPQSQFSQPSFLVLRPESFQFLVYVY